MSLVQVPRAFKSGIKKSWGARTFSLATICIADLDPFSLSPSAVCFQSRLFISFSGFSLEPEDKSPKFVEASVRLRPGMWLLQAVAPPWVNQLSFKQSYYVCHLVPLLCPRWIWDINLSLWNADTDGWQRLIQLQLGQNKHLFEMEHIVGRERGNFYPVVLIGFLF